MIHSSIAENTVISLDDVDQRILAILAEQGRAGGAEIGRRVNLSQPAISARIKRLEDAGVITGYRAEIDPRQLGRPLHAVLRLRTTQAHVTGALELFATMPEIRRIYRLTGEDCFLLDLRVADAETLELTADRIARFGPVITSLVLREYPTSPTV